MLILVQFAIISALIFAAVAIIGSMIKAAALIERVNAYERQFAGASLAKGALPSAERRIAPVMAANTSKKKNLVMPLRQKGYGIAMAKLQLAA